MPLKFDDGMWLLF